MFADALVIPQLYCKRIGAASGLSTLPLKFSQDDFELLITARYVAFAYARAACAGDCLSGTALRHPVEINQMKDALKDEEDHKHDADKGGNDGGRYRPW